MKRIKLLRYHKLAVHKSEQIYAKLCEHLSCGNFPTLLPGDPLEANLSYLLTFDDATFDFYHYIYPILQKLSLKALLAVAPRYIVEKSSLSAHERLAVPYYLAMQDGIFETSAPFCTWKELREMVHSGHVEVASHSFSHPNLTFPFVQVEKEVARAKTLLEEKLGQAVTSFIYPFGEYTEAVDALVKKHHAYRFGIGKGVEYEWKTERPLSRIRPLA